MTKFFKGRSKKAAPVPRDYEVIKTEYEALKNKSGEIQYSIYAMERDLKQVNEALVNLNYEAAARQKLDKDAAPATTVEEKQ